MADSKEKMDFFLMYKTDPFSSKKKKKLINMDSDSTVEPTISFQVFVQYQKRIPIIVHKDS